MKTGVAADAGFSQTQPNRGERMEFASDDPLLFAHKVGDQKGKSRREKPGKATKAN